MNKPKINYFVILIVLFLFGCEGTETNQSSGSSGSSDSIVNSSIHSGYSLFDSISSFEKLADSLVRLGYTQETCPDCVPPGVSEGKLYMIESNQQLNTAIDPITMVKHVHITAFKFVKEPDADMTFLDEQIQTIFLWEIKDTQVKENFEKNIEAIIRYQGNYKLGTSFLKINHQWIQIHRNWP